jgi:2-polyprenyl-3-methyl-5-hydroxy-6-metoxy-1,4-benzoquinol methylase
MKRVGLRSALGFDYSESAIGLAKLMLGNMPAEMTKNIDFELRNANQSWPEGDFDVVSMIDVMHHVNPAAQRKVFLEAVDHVAPGGLLLYKDMADRPFVFALANRVHDLIMARQWIYYVPISLIKMWAIEAGLYVVQESRCHMIWYAHEWMVFRKRPPIT